MTEEAVGSIGEEQSVLRGMLIDWIFIQTIHLRYKTKCMCSVWWKLKLIPVPFDIKAMLYGWWEILVALENAQSLTIAAFIACNYPLRYSQPCNWITKQLLFGPEPAASALPLLSIALTHRWHTANWYQNCIVLKRTKPVIALRKLRTVIQFLTIRK